MSGRRMGSSAAASMHARLCRVCEATCPRLSPVTSARAPHRRASALGDAHHEAPVDRDPRGRRDRQDDLALDLAERDQEQARGVLPLGEALDELPRLALGGVGQIGHAVEVDEDDAAPALHDPPRRDRRVDAAREQRGHRAARADGQAARPGAPLRVDEGLARQHLDAHLQLGVIEVHAHVGAERQDVGAERAIDLDRGERKRLEGPARGDAERAECAPGDGALDGGLERVHLTPRPLGEGDIGDARHAAQPVPHRRRIGVTGQVEHDASGELNEPRGAEVADGAPDVLLKVAEEERSIAALQADLMVVDDGAGARRDRRHHSPSAGRVCFGRRR